MADNPKLTIELVEKGGAASQANPGVAAGTSSGQTYDNTSSFHEKITNTGIQPPASPPQETRLNPVTEAQQNQQQQQSQYNLYNNPDAPGFQINQNTPELSSVVDRLVQADPNVSPQEVATFLGIKADQATQLIDRAKGNVPQQTSYPNPYESINTHQQNISGREQSRPVPRQEIDPATGIPYPNQQTISGYETASNRMPASTFNKGPYVDPVTGLPEAEPVTPTKPSTGYETVPSEVYRLPQTQSGGGRQPPRGPNVDPATGIPYPEETPEETPSNSSSKDVSFALNSILNATRLNNPAVSQVVSTLPMFSSELGSLGTAITSIAPPIVAAAGITAATVGLSFNEANRAVTLSREFSPEVALADAFSELRQLRADLSTAQTLGPEAANYLENTSRISAASQGLRDSISQPFLQKFNEALGGLTFLLEGMNDDGGQRGNKLGFWLSEIATAVPGIGEIVDALRLANKMKKDETQFDLYSWYNDAVPMMPLPAPFNDFDNQGQVAEPVQINAIPGLQF